MEDKKMKKEEIVNFLVTVVRDFYKPMDLCHNEAHFDEVFNEARRLGEFDLQKGVITGMEFELCLVAAAYHDIGRMFSDSRHDQEGIRMITDKYDHPIIKFLWDQYFDDEIEIICQIIKEHRSRQTASSEISAIVKDADKISRLDRERFFDRILGFNIKAIVDLPESEREPEMRRILTEYRDKHERDPKRNTGISNSFASREVHTGEEAFRFMELPDPEELSIRLEKVRSRYLEQLEKGGFYETTD